MAQAARLNLRMQKELKLLLTDPPYGASFPFLSADSDLSSLSTINAQIEGPEGTIYARGVFEVKIEIPERYPFQPPNVTFATPIYHPNIDNGGRICLDILNLPPKGAWQPSLNISTVLTSIGLLLSEPNPDDGLMCEVSREYKYNRQAFDQKARSMTEKYAKAGVRGNSCSTQGIQNFNPGMTEFAGAKESGLEIDELVLSHKKPRAVSWKLSLECSSSIQTRDSDAEVNEVEAKEKRKEVKNTVDECNLRRQKLFGIRRKLSLESSCQIQKRKGHENENVVANQSSLCGPPTIPTAYSGSSVPQDDICNQEKHHYHQANESSNGCIRMNSEQPCEFSQKKVPLDTSIVSDGYNEKMPIESQVLPSQTCSNASHGSSSMCLLVNGNVQQPHKDFIGRTGNGRSNKICKRISSDGKKLSLGLKGSSQGREKDNKENVLPIHKLPVSSPKSCSRKNEIGRKLSLGPLTQLQGNTDNNIQLLSQNLSMATPTSLLLEQHHGCDEKQSNLDDDAKGTGENEQRQAGSPISEAVIVLDSEDSEEEIDGASRSKLWLTRKRRGNWRECV